jgi:Fur family peroxide stress response transcriptional regulator
MARRGKPVTRPGPRFTARAEGMVTRLREGGLKLTPQRLAIVRAIADDESHPTAQELFERLRPELPTMSFATVYNTLDALATAGLCVSRQLSAGATRFDPNTVAHHHAVCDECSRVFDVPAGSHAARAPAADVAPGFVVRAVERVYRGVCRACAASTPARPAPGSTHASPTLAGKPSAGTPGRAARRAGSP